MISSKNYPNVSILHSMQKTWWRSARSMPPLPHNKWNKLPIGWVAWANKWFVAIKKEKSSTKSSPSCQQGRAHQTWGYHSDKWEGGNIPWCLICIKKNVATTHPGSWSKGKWKLVILWKLATISWGASKQILKHVYQEAIRPHFENGSTAWSTAAKTHQQSLDKVQNQALWIITGCMQYTPVKAMEEATAILPNHQRRDKEIMVQIEKCKCLPQHPMNESIQNLKKNMSQAPYWMPLICHSPGMKITKVSISPHLFL